MEPDGSEGLIMEEAKGLFARKKPLKLAKGLDCRLVLKGDKMRRGGQLKS